MKLKQEINKSYEEIQRMADNNPQINFEKFHSKMKAIDNEIKKK